MPSQGPGTKLVLKGLKLAFPDIAEQRAREEQEDREYRERKQLLRNVDGGKLQGPSMHSNGGNQGPHSQPRGRTRSASIRQGPSNHPNGGSRGSHHPSRDKGGKSQQHIEEERYTHTSSRSRQPSKGEFQPHIEEERYIHTSNHSRQPSVRQDGPILQSRVSRVYSNMGPRRTASTEAVAGSRATSMEPNGRRPEGGRF